MPRYENTSGKFWQIEPSLTTIDERWGEGTQVRSRVHRFDTPGQARAKADQLIADRLAAGYALVGEPAPPREMIRPRTFRRFESDHRFYEITLDGLTVVERNGTLAVGESADDDDPTVSEYGSAEQARGAFDRVTGIYAKRGYRLAEQTDSVDDDITVPIARLAANAELEALCDASPDAPGPWTVYADWLMAQGDPRGELAALHIGGKAPEALELVNRNRNLLLGGGDLARAIVDRVWRHGFLVGATVRLRDAGDSGLAEMTRTFLASPLARFVEALRFGLTGFSHDNDWRPTLDAVVASPQAARIRELRFDDYTHEDSELSWTPFGDFSGALAKLPALEVLHIKSGEGGTLGTLELPELRTFVRESGGLRATEIDAICKARWPKLVRLSIWFGSRNYGGEGNVPAIAKILDADGLANVSHLGLVNCEFSDDLIPALAQSKILPQLRTLDLSKGVMAERATALLVEHAVAFRHLAAIDLGANLLDDSEVARIVATLPQVTASAQRDYERPDPDDDDPEDDRYCAVGE